MGQISTNHGGLPSIPFPCSRGGLALASSIEQRGRYAECIGAPRRSPLAFLVPEISSSFSRLSLCCSLFSSYRSNGGRVSVISRTRARSPAISPRTNSKSLCLGSGPSPSGLMTSSRTASFTGVVPSALPSELAFCRITSTPPRTGSTASKAPVGIYRRNG